MRRMEREDSRCFVVGGGEESSKAWRAISTDGAMLTSGKTAGTAAVVLFAFAETARS